MFNHQVLGDLNEHFMGVTHKKNKQAIKTTCIKNNGRISDNIRPKSDIVRPNEKHARYSAQRKKFEKKLNVRPDYASALP